VDRLANDIVAAERKRQIADAAADFDARTGGFDDRRRFDVIDGVLVVLFEAGGDRKNVRIENDVARIESGALDEKLVRALADFHFPGNRIRLPRLVERHDDDASTIAMNGARFVKKVFLSFLQAD
jgi:hypothetical protein